MGKFTLKSGAEYLPAYNHEIGMNDDVAMSDRAGWTTSTEMLCGGRGEEYDMFGGLEVGNQYDLDVMGEDRSMTTFSSGTPEMKGKVGMMGMAGAPGMQSTQRTSGGKNVDLESPQTYSDIDQMKKG
jgi:hypothetical protein